MSESTGAVYIVKGKELRRELRRMGADMTDLKEVNKKVAKKAQARAKQLAPYSGLPRKRHARDSVRARGTQTVAAIYAWQKGYPWVGPTHWGWPSRGQEPQPFMSDAVATLENDWVQDYFKLWDKTLESYRGE